MNVLTSNRNLQGWFSILVLTSISLVLQEHLAWMSQYPSDLIMPFADWLNFLMEMLIKYLGWIFLSISWLLEWPIKGAQWLLHSLPWVVIVFLIGLTAYVASGWRLALFSISATLYMVVIGYWEESMNTLALVVISVPLAIIIGFGIGIWGFYSKKAERIIMPILDIFQTVPTFAYLLPILLLFGF
jgi:glycine betaine/proline transport system permease protein